MAQYRSLTMARNGGLRVIRGATVVASLVAPSGMLAAQNCTPASFAAAVDRAGGNLRTMTSESAPKLQALMRQLRAKRGWSETETEDKAYALLADARLNSLDQQSSDLVQRIDTLGAIASGGTPDCSKIPELDAASLELQATVRTRMAYVLQKLESLVAEGGPPTASPTPTVAAPLPQGKPEAKPETRQAAPAPLPPVAAVTPPAAKPPAKPAPPWSTSTTPEVPRPQASTPPTQAQSQPPSLPPGALMLPPDDDGYTIDEIASASEGVFGKVTASLGSVIEHAFRKSGRPAGYIIGTEGGGALVAGVRYGQGTLYMRTGGTTRVYWHGPSLGLDVGAAGSRTMFLIYKLGQADDLFSSFTGIDGSAYVVGGLGLTLMTNGTVQLAPIRSGLGLRVGANLGYLRFTRRPTWNPF